MMTTVLLSMKLACEREGIAEVKLHRLGSADHLLEQPELGLVLDIADCARPAPERPPPPRGAVGMPVEPFDARRRHGVDAGNDEKPPGGGALLFCRDAPPRAPRRQHRFRA